MKRHQTLLAGLAIAVLGAGAAAADCAQELEALDAGGGEIAKDGTLAPLQDGGEGGGAAGVATSAQDAQAQQEGGETAAAEGGAGTADDAAAVDQAAGGEAASGGEPVVGAETAAADAGDRDAAIERARAALAAGDEEGCMAAVEEARTL
jgi:hypothetical protein